MWIRADRQTAGRGRRGRAWESPTGNLAATLLLVTDKPAAEAAQISFVAALSVADLADLCVGPGSAALKWPNDLLIHGRKAAGILVESGARPDRRLWLAVGIGVNLTQAPQGLERPAAAFSEFAPPPTPAAALDILALRFDAWRSLWDRDGFAPIAQAWTDRAHGLGQPCQARLPDRTLHGVAEGLDPDGALRLRLDGGGITRITAGDVFFGDS